MARNPHNDLVNRLTSLVETIQGQVGTSRNSNAEDRSVDDTLATLFPSTRGGNLNANGQERRQVNVFSSSATRAGSRPTSGRRQRTRSQPKGKSSKASNLSIMKDIILLPHPRMTKVPRGHIREELYERKLVHTAFELSSEAPHTDIIDQFTSSFSRRLKGNSFEFVRAVGNKIVPANIPQCNITGRVVKHIAGQGPVYIRSTVPIAVGFSWVSDSDDDEHDAGGHGSNGLDQDSKSSGSEDDESDLKPAFDGGPNPSHGHNHLFSSSDHDVVQVDSDGDHGDLSTHDDVSNYTSATHSVTNNIPGPATTSEVVDTSANSLTNIFVSSSSVAQPSNALNTVASAAGEDSSTITSDVTVERPVKCIRVHRAMIKQELMEIFSDPSIMDYPLSATIINQHGEEEAGVGSGVLKELFSVFWKEFYESHMLGEDGRVPYIRHDYNREKWEAVGRIFVKGFLDCSYFPLKLSQAFISACLFGEANVSDDLLMSSFKLYVSRSEADLIDKCLQNGIKADDDDLLSFLSNFDCKRRVTEANMMEIINEIAHKELIQKPQYVSDCWRAIVSPLRLYFTGTDSLSTYYDSIRPTTAKVLALLQANPSTPAESETLCHLNRFVRGLDPERLATFLRFTTASDIIVCDKIEISFLNVEGLQRRPVAHTCGYLLEIPSTYNNFCELREEFTSILQSGTWEIDIV